MSADEPVVDPLPEALRGRRQLRADDRIQFACDPGLPCFTRCCADVNIFLTPVDVLRLSRRLGLDTKEFLDRHALLPITKDLHLPVVVLRMDETPDKRCPFVAEAGCTVYEDRPWACRMYPIASAVPPARAGVEPQPMYFLLEDGLCKGHGTGATWTVDTWRTAQGVTGQEDLEAGFREIVSHPWFIGGRQLNPKQMEMFFTACYDLDAFRRFVFESTFMDRFVLPEESVEEIRRDDEALLRFAYVWLRFALFGEPTLPIRDSARNAVAK